ncbi:2796_t:CDS:10 [Dentiscutata erythropus]|uniref:2796_t:CDS:1 n=1 Tax=Dentiscutata erythropus TaxID=1348616 RepID=A0A9N9F8B3_9GLOM|nr:2796_t:CDS:10 [Dentiscutata erythropus]
MQAKVRSATSNDPWGPSGTAMNEIAQATYDPHYFIEIMEMVDKRLNDSGKNWRHVFKALTLLDYCLHVGSKEVVAYAKENIYVVKTLREFQYIDDDGKDQGANVRQKAKDITNLLQDDERLNSERRQRANMRDRLTGHNELPGSTNRNVDYAGDFYDHPGNLDDEDADIKKAMEESLKSANESEKNSKREKEDLERALKLSKEEEEKRQAMVEKQNEKSLFDPAYSSNISQLPQQQTDFFGNPMAYTNSQFNQLNQFSGNQNSQPLDLFGSIDNQALISNQSQYLNNPYQLQQQSINPYQQSPILQTNVAAPKPNSTDEKHPQLAALFGNIGDGGMDTFGNVGNLRVPTGSGFAGSIINESSSSIHSPRRSNSTGNISQPNPFLNSGDTNNVGSGAFNTLPSNFNSQSAASVKNDFPNTFSTNINQPGSSFSTSSFTTSLPTSNSLIDLDTGSFNSQASKNPFQTQQTIISNDFNKPKSLLDLQREQQFQQSQSNQSTNLFGNQW